MLKSMQELAEEAKRDIPEVQTADVKRDVDGGKLPYVLIDVREPAEQDAGIIPGALPIARGVLEMQIPKVTQDENAPIVCYCGGGTRSLFAAQQLKRMGFKNVKSLAGGFRGWTNAGNPTASPK